MAVAHSQEKILRKLNLRKDTNGMGEGDKFIKKTSRKGGFELVKNILKEKLEKYKQYGNMYYHTIILSESKQACFIKNHSSAIITALTNLISS